MWWIISMTRSYYIKTHTGVRRVFIRRLTPCSTYNEYTVNWMQHMLIIISHAHHKERKDAIFMHYDETLNSTSVPSTTNRHAYLLCHTSSLTDERHTQTLFLRPSFASIIKTIFPIYLSHTSFTFVQFIKVPPFETIREGHKEISYLSCLTCWLADNNN